MKSRYQKHKTGKQGSQWQWRRWHQITFCLEILRHVEAISQQTKLQSLKLNTVDAGNCKNAKFKICLLVKFTDSDRLILICLKSRHNSFWMIVDSLDQRLTRHVIFSLQIKLKIYKKSHSDAESIYSQPSPSATTSKLLSRFHPLEINKKSQVISRDATQWLTIQFSKSY